MTIKKLTRPFLQFFASVLIVFVPFYWIKGMSSKINQLNRNSRFDVQNRKHDDYSIYDVNNEKRGAIRFFSIMLPMSCAPLIAALMIPLVGHGFGIALAIIVGMGILPNLFDIIAKQTIRAISWLKNKDDPSIINPCYPGKYKAYNHDSSIKIMQKLYQEKQKIKHNPEGWFGLSDEQKKHCTAINLAVKLLRKEPFSVDKFNDKQGFTKQMADFLTAVTKEADSTIFRPA